MTYFDSVLHINKDEPNSPIGQWQNWSQNQKSHPMRLFQPTSTSELAAELAESDMNFRVIGSGHSFSALAKTRDTLISLNQMTGLLGHNSESHTARIMAGTPLHQLSPILDSIDQGMVNMGDINHQSIAGAIATGTHGTGAELPCLSALVNSLTLITPAGKVIECSTEHNAELFKAAKVNLGCLGIVTEVELQNRPAYRLKESIEVCPLEDVLDQIDTLKKENRHIEFFSFAYSDQVILKTLNITDKSPTPATKSLISDDALLRFFCEITKKAPALTSLIHKHAHRFISSSQRVDVSHKVFASPRSVRFNEMEYQVPAELGPNCLRDIFKYIRKHSLPAFFPIEYRYVAGDTLWMSPFYRQDSASISIHHYFKQDYQTLFDTIEPIFDQYQGRPHWGKLHSKQAAQLKALYPRWDDWQAIREELDPTHQMLSPAIKAWLTPEEKGI
jgi:FAD-linked oxidoreductase